MCELFRFALGVLHLRLAWPLYAAALAIAQADEDLVAAILIFEHKSGSKL